MDNEHVFTVVIYLMPCAVLYSAVVFPRDRRIWMGLGGLALLVTGWFAYQTLFDKPSTMHLDLGPGFRMISYTSLFSATILGLMMRATGAAEWLRSVHWSCLPISVAVATISAVAIGARLSFLAGSI